MRDGPSILLVHFNKKNFLGYSPLCAGLETVMQGGRSSVRVITDDTFLVTCPDCVRMLKEQQGDQ